METESRFLGKPVSYPVCYDPSILVPVSRRPNREIYDITMPESLFCGFDAWHAYEAGFITQKGLPVVGVLKIVYPSTTPFIIESKSLKLYLNSLNMTPMGEDPESGIDLFVNTVKNDLSANLHAPVEVSFFRERSTHSTFDFSDYTLLDNIESVIQATYSIYQEYPEILKEDILTGGEIKVYSHLLRSNCKITNQPDWGSVYLHLKGDSLPSPVALVKYIVSLRTENHFHEEICEMIFKRLTDIFSPEILSVSCLYTRRGGIDICPSRANKPEFLPPNLLLPDNWTQPMFRQ